MASLSRLPKEFWSDLTASPYDRDLFQLLRRIDAEGGQPFLLGCSPRPSDEILRLGQKPSLSFAASTVASVTSRRNSAVHDILIYSFGLFGPNGPLPLHLTEYVSERVNHYQDESLLAFVNLFHHRLIGLFYRAWANAQQTVSLDRSEQGRFDRYIAHLTGIGEASPALNIAPHARYFMAGHLACQSRPPEGLENILHHYFNVPVQIVQFIPQWMAIEKDEQAQLKKGRENARLGLSTFLGLAVRDVTYKFRVVLGPLSKKDYDGFLPGASLYKQLVDWVHQYVGIEFEWEVQLIMASEELNGTSLGGVQRLGLSSWLGIAKPGEAGRDLIYVPSRIGCVKL